MEKREEELRKKEPFGPHARLPIQLSEGFHNLYTVRDGSEFNLLDKWRIQHGHLMHELVCIAESGGDRGQKDKLTRALLDVVAKDEFVGSYNHDLYREINDIEKQCGESMMKWALSEVAIFVSYWNGRFAPSEARRRVLSEAFEEEKRSRSDWPLDQRLWGNCAVHYFYGCTNHKFDTDNEQNVDVVIAGLEEDLEWVREDLCLDINCLNDTFRVLKLDFLRGDYPISTDYRDEICRETAKSLCRDFVQESLEESRSGSTPSRVSYYMSKYRQREAMGRSFYDEEDDKNDAESDAYEVRQQEKIGILDSEQGFIETLELPEWEQDSLPRRLEDLYARGWFNPNPDLQDDVHDHVSLLVHNLPEDSSNMDEPWIVIDDLMIAYWSGKYYPDNVRRMVLNTECERLFEKSCSGDCDVSTPTIFDMHRKFVDGSRRSNSMHDENSVMVEQAYQADMEIIRGLGFPEDDLESVETVYNTWFLEGNLTLVPSCETQVDRERLATRFYHMNALEHFNGPYAGINILQEFCYYWQGIEGRKSS